MAATLKNKKQDLRFSGIFLFRVVLSQTRDTISGLGRANTIY